MSITNKTIYVTPATAALATGLSLNAIYRHLRLGNLEASKIPGLQEWLITKQDLQEFIAARAKGRYTHQFKTAEGYVRKRKKSPLIETSIRSKVLTVPTVEQSSTGECDFSHTSEVEE